MDIFVGVDTLFVRTNQVSDFKVEITNMRSLFKTKIHNKFEFSAFQENSQQ
jgi:hypothetical protein